MSCTYIHTYLHAYVHTYVCNYVHVRVTVHNCAYVYMPYYLTLSECVHICIYTCACMHICIHVSYGYLHQQLMFRATHPGTKDVPYHVVAQLRPQGSIRKDSSGQATHTGWWRLLLWSPVARPVEVKLESLIPDRVQGGIPWKKILSLHEKLSSKSASLARQLLWTC